MATLQHLPYLGTAEEDVLFVDWLVAEGQTVTAGQTLATIETLKAAFDVEAEVGGVLLRHLCAPGTRVAARAPLAVIGATGEACDDAALQRLLPTTPAAAGHKPMATRPTIAAPAELPPPVAPAARRRAIELGVDLADVVGTGPDGLVRVADVELAAANSQRPSDPTPPAADDTAATDDDTTDATTIPVRVGCPCAPCDEQSNDGNVDPAFLAAIRQDPGFAQLSSALKVLLYERHGAHLPDAHFAPGAVLLAGRICLGPGARFGRDTVIEAQRLCAGPLLHFGARCRVRATSLRFGSNAFFTDDIEVGGGGAMDPEAELRVGSHGFVGEHVHLNPCRRLVVGDEVVISRSACVMTHSFGPSWLRGYPSRFAGVTIGEGAQIGIGAVLFPGVEIGAGAVVLSGSSVVTSVPPGRLVGGVPAQDLKAAAQQLSPAQVADRARELVIEFGRQLAQRGRHATITNDHDALRLEVVADDGPHRLEFAAVADFAAATDTAERVLVAVSFADETMLAAPATTTTIGLEPPRLRGPLGPLAAAFREFLRKRGCRLEPRTWAYTGGWL
ncbi:MAG: E3 binding domain-containing protein [Planctomycetes bacterium]|nr:E3 binding domain-containing protein [Planctomycetota bacterium]